MWVNGLNVNLDLHKITWSQAIGGFVFFRAAILHILPLNGDPNDM